MQLDEKVRVRAESAPSVRHRDSVLAISGNVSRPCAACKEQ